MSNKTVVDCVVVKDEHGRTQPTIATTRGMNQAEEDALVALHSLVPVSGVALNSGRVTLALLDGTSKAVVFAQEMRSADYVVTLNATVSLGARLWTTGYTTTGFTLNLSVAIAGTIEYIAHEVT